MSMIHSGRKDLDQGLGGANSQSNLDNEFVEMLP